MVLIPTYNEADNVQPIVRAVLAAAPVDVMVLDDNSPDGTGVLAEALATNDPRVRVLHRPKKEGLGRAYLEGMAQALAAGYTRICEMDADFSHPPSVLPKLLAASERVDLVLGSRNVPGGGTKNWPLHRRLISRGGSLYARTILGVPVRDLTGGFKVFHRRVLEAIDLPSVRSNGYAFQIEMTYRTVRRGFSIEEVPFVFVERESGVSKMSRGIVLEAVLMCPKLRLGGTS
ncbi:MAG: polyprenol monophosphomannose synthase [Deltaproteobacteria bacterium]|nr:polyprenol monophosphomannose synthase [Deltaproteobacteria bacterium]